MNVSSEEIRRLVREVLKVALPTIRAVPAAAGGLVQRLRAALAGNKRVDVTIAHDGDLNSFARDLVAAAEQPDLREAVKTGALTFALARAGNAVQATTAYATTTQAAHRVDKGLLTETMVTEIGRGANRIVTGKGVVVTPLGRDRARELKIEIVRDRS
jgi:hypothetical protein